MTSERQIIFHGHYFQDFYLEVNDSVKDKIGYVFQKKTQKLPKQQIELAEKLKKEYFALKDTQNGKKRSNKKR